MSTPGPRVCPTGSLLSKQPGQGPLRTCRGNRCWDGGARCPRCFFPEGELSLWRCQKSLGQAGEDSSSQNELQEHLPPCPQNSGDAPTFLLVWVKRKGGQPRIICDLGAVLTQGMWPRGAPTCSFWVTTGMKGRGEKVSVPRRGMEKPPSSLGGTEASSPCSLQPAGWMIYFTNQTSESVWGSHALIISLNVPFTCTEPHFFSFSLFAPPLANPTPGWGITFFKQSQAAIASPPPPPRPTEQCIFTPRITRLHPKPSSTLFLLSLSY